MDNHKPSAECVDDELGTRLQFDNPSDAVFASLFLKADGISWTTFNTILSTLRTPSFDIMQVTFKDSDDFFARISRIRERSLLKRNNIELPVVGLPEVILEGVFDILGSELQYPLHLIRDENQGYVVCNSFGTFPGVYQSWKATLINYALVHSSWVVCARRALGYCHWITQDFLLRSIRSPWIGGWTRDVHLEFCNDTTFSSNAEFLRPLFAHLPNVRLLTLTVYSGGLGRSNTDSSSSTFFGSLKLLPYLDELAFNASRISTSFVETLSANSHPNLKILRIFGFSGTSQFKSGELPQQLLSSISSFPSLHSFHLNSLPGSPEGKFLNGVSWLKAKGQFTASPTFSLSDLYVVMFDSDLARGANHWKQWASFFPFAQRMYCKCYRIWGDTDLLLPELRVLLQLCTSLRSLDMDAGEVESGVPSVMTSIPLSVEEVDFRFSTVPAGLFEPSVAHPPSLIEEWDAQLALMLDPGTSPNLRALRLHFANGMSELYPHEIYMQADRQLYRIVPPQVGAVQAQSAVAGGERGPLFPACQMICYQRGIQFSVDECFARNEWL